MVSLSVRCLVSLPCSLSGSVLVWVRVRVMETVQFSLGIMGSVLVHVGVWVLVRFHVCFRFRVSVRGSCTVEGWFEGSCEFEASGLYSLIC